SVGSVTSGRPALCSTGDSLASGSATASASPKTTVTARAGARYLAAAAATSSRVAVDSAVACLARKSRRSPWPAYVLASPASPAWVDIPSRSDPSAYWRACSSSSSVGGTVARRPSSYHVSSSAGAVTSVATSAESTRADPAIECSITECGLYV